MALVWIWTFVWGFGITVAFLIWGHRRDFLPRSVRVLSNVACWLCGIKVSIENEERMYTHSPCIILANHQTGFDVPIFGKYSPPNVVWIAKKELGSLPLIGWVLRRTRTILIDRKNRSQAFQQLSEAGKRIADEKCCVVVLPEGTRNGSAPQLLPFKRGPFFLAKAANVPMVPVICSSLKEVAHMKTGRLGGNAKIRILPPVMPEGTPEEMAVKLRQIMQTAFEQLNREMGITSI